MEKVKFLDTYMLNRYSLYQKNKYSKYIEIHMYFFGTAP